MSEANVEIARAAIEAVLRRPKPDYAAMNTLFYPNHEFLSYLEGAVEGRSGSHRGAQGWREYQTSLAETFEWEMALEEVTEIDHQRVLAVLSTKVRGRQSGAATEQRLAAVLTAREGKVVRTQLYGSPEEALEAAGLSE
jgi:ketosteroid isomerase-like protein